MSTAEANEAVPIGRGASWEDLRPGMLFRTIRRTVTETDLVNFISVTGMLESIFIDATFDGAISGRAVPAALTYSLMEGLQLQGLYQETGLAMLEVNQRALKPVRVSDTIHATVRVVDIKPTSKNNRAVVTTHVEVFNQAGETVMTYDIKRLLAGALK